jgi:glycosyltransferase involved in cell wall biosynthesis
MSRPGIISVIMPAYNRQNYITESIASICAQTGGLHEIIVIDDGSTDNTAASARACSPSVVCHSQPNQGIGSALNHGLRHATGEWLAFLDSDDLWAPGKSAAQLAYFDAHPSVDLVFGHCEEFISPELPAGRISFGDRAGGARPARLYGTLLARRESFLRVGSFDEKTTLGHFIDWHARARALGLSEGMVADTVLHRRIHGNNITMQRRAGYRDYLKIVKSHIDRSRSSLGPS